MVKPHWSRQFQKFDSAPDLESFKVDRGLIAMVNPDYKAKGTFPIFGMLDKGTGQLRPISK